MNASVLVLLASVGCFAPNRAPEGGATDGAEETSESTGGTFETSSEAESWTTTLGTSGDATTGGSGGETETTSDTFATTGGPETATEAGTEGETEGGATCEGVCVEGIPAGWEGPFLRPSAPEPQGATGCSAAYPEQVYQGFDTVSGAPASCGCECGEPGGGQCEDDVDISYYNQSIVFGCNDDNFLYTDPASDALDLIDAQGQEFGYRIGVSLPNVLSAPSCLPTTEETIPPVQVSGEVELCEGDSVGSCEMGELCMPTFDADFAIGHCIARDGAHECPEGSAYSEERVYYRAISDTRECSQCGCGPANDVACGGTVDTLLEYGFGGGAVEDPEASVPAGTTCSVIIAPDNNPSFGVNYYMTFELDSATPDSSGCAPTGGDAQGSATGQDAFTVCCAS